MNWPRSKAGRRQSRTRNYAYNAFGELVEQTDAKGQLTTMSYDEQGRRRTRQVYWADGSLAVADSWSYDDGGFFGQMAGRLVSSLSTHTNTAGTALPVGPPLNYA